MININSKKKLKIIINKIYKNNVHTYGSCVFPNHACELKLTRLKLISYNNSEIPVSDSWTHNQQNWSAIKSNTLIHISYPRETFELSKSTFWRNIGGKWPERKCAYVYIYKFSFWIGYASEKPIERKNRWVGVLDGPDRNNAVLSWFISYFSREQGRGTGWGAARRTHDI